MAGLPLDNSPSEESKKSKFSQFLTSSVIAVTVAKSKTFYLHSDLLTAESQRFSNSLTGKFMEAEASAIEIEDEDPDLFGFFVEYLYRDRSVLSREVQHYSEYVTLARLYAMGERLMAPKLQTYSLWRFAQSLASNTFISEESICELLRIACTEITERASEDPMRAQIFWYRGDKNHQPPETPHVPSIAVRHSRLGEATVPVRATKPTEKTGHAE
ncbi:hypothetical protein BU26DRAFT_514416 [Trematosphaeria pertusa]|uniref:BTB domain-containing protein n=1 Tax=Trematosphaeria pertusa TaxID=390896 RepID=A0A6A6IVC9_9PLEO|nr:uncharacterized protein BU26DRAFT_514416 [Trematosphaeria pertusa]KAF2254525.1 hypothetical protein BU26DRAFT_514416 [Trematosphaeria pertusa]